MSEWREVMLGDLCTRVTVGHVGKMADEYVPDGVPFLRSQNVKPFRISSEGLLHVSEHFHQKLANSKLAAGDVVVILTGYPGTAAVIPDQLAGSHCADLVVSTTSAAPNAQSLSARLYTAWDLTLLDGHLS